MTHSTTYRNLKNFYFPYSKTFNNTTKKKILKYLYKKTKKKSVFKIDLFHMLMKITFNRWTLWERLCEYIIHTTYKWYLFEHYDNTQGERSKNKFIWKEGRFGIMVNMDFLFSYHLAQRYRKRDVAGERNEFYFYFIFFVGREPDQHYESRIYACMFWDDNCEQQKPYVHVKIYFIKWRKKKKLLKKRKKVELMKRHTSFIDKKPPEDYWLILPTLSSSSSSSVAFSPCQLTTLLYIFHEISYVQQ